MDIPFLLLAIIAACFLGRATALLTTVVLWTVAVAMVGWGPAHSDGVHTASLGFWGPWLAVLTLALLLVTGIHAIRSRRRAKVTAG
jgi:hypothetical protein